MNERSYVNKDDYQLVQITEAIQCLETLEIWGKRPVITSIKQQLQELYPVIEQEIIDGRKWIEAEVHKVHPNFRYPNQSSTIKTDSDSNSGSGEEE
jgi:hypothetical protein